MSSKRIGLNGGEERRGGRRLSEDRERSVRTILRQVVERKVKVDLEHSRL